MCPCITALKIWAVFCCRW